jgi:hypothetical protein
MRRHVENAKATPVPLHPGEQTGSPYVIMHDEKLGETDGAVVG